MIVNDQIKKLAAQIVGGETNPILAARKILRLDPSKRELLGGISGSHEGFRSRQHGFLFKHKIRQLHDFHSLFASLSMAAGIPTRMVYGSLLKPALDGVKVDASYHCWIQFYAPNYGWVPLDVSLADIYGKEFP